ncbi:MAG TPA: ATP-dependent DNA helicase PcrA, partial [Phaeodactylibacter sp.]|nr:ATP-dependent DNA helicase PcrA [Phaeodactylibacter sp.]
RKEIKDVLAYLRLVVYEDDISFLRIINMPSRGLGKKFLEYLAAAQVQGTSLYATLKQNLDNPKLKRPGAAAFIQLIESFKKQREKKNLSDMVKLVLDKSGLTERYRKDGDTDRLDNIAELQNGIIAMEKQDEEKINIEDYLQEVSLYTDIDAKDTYEDKVKLMTIHISKGLEFPYVFLYGFTEGILPSARSMQERRRKALEEERRLCYVAITRAQKGFYMVESEDFDFSTYSSKLPSRFLFEMSEKSYRRIGKLSKSLIREAKRKIANSSFEGGDRQRFVIGDKVLHPVWNLGEIIAVDEDKESYQVSFEDLGKTKPIAFDYELLERVG